MKKIFISSDHAGFKLKEDIKFFLKKRKYSFIDLGPDNDNRVDYPDYAHKLCEEVLNNQKTNGILICGSGIGMSMTANRHEGIRAALCHDAYTATVARKHNDANVLCFGERIVGHGVCESILDAWIIGGFDGGRHINRVTKIELQR